MVWQGLLQSLLPLLGGALTLVVIHRRKEEPEDETWQTPIGSQGIGMALAFAIFLWILPAGAILALPLLLLVSLLSPAARDDWKTHRTPRMIALSVAILCLTATGFLPVNDPVAPSEWGQPLFSENPDAPLYPASEQYTWVTTDVEILQSISMRLPHQTGLMGSEWTALSLASLLNMETGRMHQAIQLLDEEVSIVRLDPETVLLEPVPAPNELDVRLLDETTVTVEFRRYDIKSTAFGLDSSGTKVGEVALSAVASWGGQLDMLILVRPIGHPDLERDAFGESLQRQWLEARP